MPSALSILHRTSRTPDTWVFEGHVVVLKRHPRARRYTLRLNRDNELVVTVPRGGSHHHALEFVQRSRGWIDGQRLRRQGAPGHATEWCAGTDLLLRGHRVLLALGHEQGRPYVSCGDERIFIADRSMNLRRPVEAHLLRLARTELPRRTRELAREHGITVARISVRNQSSRWGSCSATGVISLNWRLIQAPDWVRDYLVIHELMHRREMNHSIRFWRHVAHACPRWREAEAWLDRHAVELGF
ncbi:MAG: M48 family metallopeptidase [Opitutaceae bacterium]|nr:M48 family metallopeptidase [Opitutaceae bacterium]